MLRQGLAKVLLLASVMHCAGVHAQETAADARPEVRVTTTAMADIWVQPLQRVVAEVTALNHAQISAQANGEVLKLDVEVGDSVEKGETMIELDCRQSELSEAVLNDVLNLARKEYKRAQTLQKSKTIAEQEITRLQSVLEQARIRIKQAELAVEHCLIKAPYSGVVTERQVQLGMIATVGAPMVKLLQVDAVEVFADLDTQSLSSLQNSEDIFFESAGQAYPLTIRTALPLLDPASNKQRLRLAFVGARPYSGAAGELRWSASDQYLPANMLMERNGQLGYFIVQEQIAKFIALPGAMLGHPAVLHASASASGATPVILEGRFRLKDGDRVVRREADN